MAFSLSSPFDLVAFTQSFENRTVSDVDIIAAVDFSCIQL